MIKAIQTAIFIAAFLLIAFRSWNPDHRFKPLLNVLYGIAVFSVAVFLSYLLKVIANGH